jgi:hypothetical protein
MAQKSPHRHRRRAELNRRKRRALLKTQRKARRVALSQKK